MQAIQIHSLLAINQLVLGLAWKTNACYTSQLCCQQKSINVSVYWWSLHWLQVPTFYTVMYCWCKTGMHFQFIITSVHHALNIICIEVDDYELNLLLWHLIAVGLSGLSYWLLRGAGVLWGSVSITPFSTAPYGLIRKIINVFCIKNWVGKNKLET